MGGWGSTRWRSEWTRRTTYGALGLDIRQVAREVGLQPNRRCAWRWWLGEELIGEITLVTLEGRVVLLYRWRECGEDEWRDVRCPVRIVETPCHYGGTRPWWECPRCRRRAAVLYHAGSGYACRACCRLAYPSTREDANDRYIRTARKIRQRLGVSENLLDFWIEKPKGMHWRTFGRLRNVLWRAGIADLRRYSAMFGGDSAAEVEAFAAQLEERMQD